MALKGLRDDTKKNILNCIKFYLQGLKNNSDGGYVTNIAKYINERIVGVDVTADDLEEICAAEDNNYEISRAANGRKIVKRRADKKRKIDSDDGHHMKNKSVKVSIMSFFSVGI